jgi:hypothetical protein
LHLRTATPIRNIFKIYLIFLNRANMGNIADVSEVHSDSIFKVKVTREGQYWPPPRGSIGPKATYIYIYIYIYA